MAPLAKRRVAPALRPSLSVPDKRAPAARPRPRELWLAVHLPALMLDSLRDQLRALPGNPPVAAVDLERNGKVVRACDEEVRAAGVHTGMSVNSALALVPALHAVARDARRERQLLEAVARHGLHFTPRVSLEPPDDVLLEVRGSLRLFGGARQLCHRLEREIGEATGATVRFAITPSPLASAWFARMHAGERPVLVRSREELASRIAPLPLACTRWPEKVLQTLATMGVRTVGECLRLPRDGFARRFGANLLAMLDRATGRLAEPRPAFAAHEKFALRRDLEPEVDDTARLGLVLEPMLAELCRFLRERSRGVQAIEVQLRHRESPLTRVRLRFVQPVGAQPQRIGALLRERLARLELPEPVRNVRLVSGPLIDLHSDAPELFAHDRRESGENVPELIERLRARLGYEAVHGLACVAEHRPEAAWRAVEEPSPALRATSPAAAGEGEGEGEGARPLWLLEAPEPCDARHLEIEEGPECIETGWWDGHDVARDYYLARNRHGARLWVFRNRRETGPGGWYLHGWFA
ncbi:MAG TPA: DNA polymerase Y family protein [Steroidobacteraceae bacterium]|nr:DNA polymerase Y family protein [Steroidobacteraceae bacterium]